jgi:hypothetical protein
LVLGLGSSKLARQNQDQQNNNHKAEAAAVVAGPVEGATPESGKASDADGGQIWQAAKRLKVT